MSKGGLEKFTYADVVRMTRPDPDLGTQSTQLGTHTVGRLGTQSTRATQSTLGTQQSDADPVLTMPEAVAAPKRKDDREQLNLKLSQALLEQLRRYAFDNRLTVKDVVVQALEMLLGTQGTQGRLVTQGRNLPTLNNDFNDDDLRARETIIEVYEKATGKTFTEKDHECLKEYVHYGIDCLTLAILMGRNRCRGTINAFRYFEKIIIEVAAWQPDKIKRELPFQWAQFRRRVNRER